jgi:hypothetical protein
MISTPFTASNFQRWKYEATISPERRSFRLELEPNLALSPSAQLKIAGAGAIDLVNLDVFAAATVLANYCTQSLEYQKSLPAQAKKEIDKLVSDLDRVDARLCSFERDNSVANTAISRESHFHAALIRFRSYASECALTRGAGRPTNLLLLRFLRDLAPIYIAAGGRSTSVSKGDGRRRCPFVSLAWNLLQCRFDRRVYCPLSEQGLAAFWDRHGRE